MLYRCCCCAVVPKQSFNTFFDFNATFRARARARTLLLLQTIVKHFYYICIPVNYCVYKKRFRSGRNRNIRFVQCVSGFKEMYNITVYYTFSRQPKIRNGKTLTTCCTANPVAFTWRNRNRFHGRCWRLKREFQSNYGTQTYIRRIEYNNNLSYRSNISLSQAPGLNECNACPCVFANARSKKNVLSVSDAFFTVRRFKVKYDESKSIPEKKKRKCEKQFQTRQNN